MTTTFRYRAAAADGREVRGELRAPSSRAAIEELRRQSLVPVALEDARAMASGATATRPLAVSIGRGRADEARAASVRTIATMVAAGATLDRSLAFAATHARHGEVGRALERVRDGVRRGESLSTALSAEQATFGGFAAAVARAGEEGGSLDEGLARLADHYDRMRDLRGQLQRSLLYPALMGTVAGVGVTILLLVVVPRFVSILGETGGTLPRSTQLLVATSALARTWWWLAASMGIVGAAYWWRWSAAPANRRRWHAWRLTWPIVGAIERDVNAGRVTRALGTLLRGGVGVLGALAIARDAAPNADIAARLADAASRVARGETLSTSLEGILPPLATQLLAVGEESGTLGEMAMRVAEELERESQAGLRALVALVEPTLIIVFGGFVGFVALAMLQAVYSINGAIR